MLKTLAFILVLMAGAASAPPSAYAQQGFVLPDLPYDVAALEPVIDAQTMEIHHGRHHQAYVDNLNAALQANPALRERTLETLLADISSHPAAIRNNGGGHYNHSLFWRLLAPPGQGGEASSALAARITEDFGSLEAMQRELSQAASGQFGSGWAWLVWTGERLIVTSTTNQDNPLMDVADVQGAPILAVDVWEHAYYLRYQNRRADYLSAWWSIVNWNEANRLFAEATLD